MIRSALLLSAFTLALSACVAGEAGLKTIHGDIVADYPAVTHLSSQALSQKQPENILLLDIRERDEFAVSHLPGAIQITPNMPLEETLIRIGDISGKEIIVYCSVGRRSSDFANRIQSRLLEKGASSVSNLENGVFGWHNEERDLVDGAGPTEAVHPYDEVWKRYVVRDEKARYIPE